jgi:hypothetical protein
VGGLPKHQAFSDEGCEIFVKVRQFDMADTERVVIDTREAEFRQGLVPGLKVLPESTGEA